MSVLNQIAEKVSRDLQDAKVYAAGGANFPAERILENLRDICSALQHKRALSVRSQHVQQPCRICGAPSCRQVIESIDFDDENFDREPECAYLCDSHYRAIFKNEAELPNTASVLFSVARKLGVTHVKDILPKLNAVLRTRPPESEVAPISSALRQ